MKSTAKKVTFVIIFALFFFGIGMLISQLKSSDSHVDESFGDNLELRYRIHGDELVYYVYNTETDRKTVRNAGCYLVRPEGDDNLTGVSCDGRWGYVSNETGKPVIDFQYCDISPFSGGIASVMDFDSTVTFILTDGSKAFERTFHANGDEMPYFHGAFCAVDSCGKYGLINKRGEQVINFLYLSAEFITNDTTSYWYFQSGDNVLVLNSHTLDTVLFTQGDNVTLSEEGIAVHQTTKPTKLYDYGGKLLIGQTYSAVINPEINYSNHYEDKDCQNLFWSSDYSHYGLMDKRGNILTDAIFRDITPVSADLYVADLYDSDESVLLDTKGNIVNK